MKLTHKKLVTVTLEMNEWEAVALAQLCIQVGGAPGNRRSFYLDVYEQIREGLGEVPSSRGVFEFSTNGIVCAAAVQAPEKKA